MTNAVVVLSGGLDSTTLLHKTAARYPHHQLHAISFNYGQRHAKELEFARWQADVASAEHKIVDLQTLMPLFAESGSSLVTDHDVPDGHYGEESMKQTVVPNRNMIMLSIATGYAVSLKAEVLAIGVHAGDHFIYPDCRPEFISQMRKAILSGNEGFIHEGFRLWTPFMGVSKNRIAEEAFDLGVDIRQTWSCYKGGQFHCGMCGTCVERQEAIASTGFEDPTPYVNNSYWRTALERKTV